MATDDVAIGRRVRAWAPGRVNLIGDHTDYTGGLAFPMAIELGTRVTGVRGGDRVKLRSEAEAEPVDLPLPLPDPATVEPAWGRYVAGVVAEVAPDTGFTGSVSSTLPVGAGLSSSAALELAVALAVGFEGSPLELARRCQAAEQRASGVPCGILDQLTSAAGVVGHGLLLDCTTLEITPVAMPDDVEVFVLNPGEPRSLAGSAYADRRAACEAAAALIGPLRQATLAAVEGLEDQLLRRRARHVVTENARVLAFTEALRSGDLATAGEAMWASHASLRDDFEVSTPGLDALVAALRETPGVHGARLTGAGFGGCVVALARPGAIPWASPVKASGPARLEAG
jgi:galactokinase